MNKKLDQSVFENAPDWAQWAAVEPDGGAFFYETKPMLISGDLLKTWCKIGKARSRAIGAGFESSRWKHSLIERKGE